VHFASVFKEEMKLLNTLAFLDKQYVPLPGIGKQILLFVIVNTKRIFPGGG